MLHVRPINTLERFQASLELRFQVYQSLGYLKHRRDSDIDEFDWSSLHFEAVDDSDSIVGVVRLVLPNRLDNNNHVPNPVIDWCEQLNQEQSLGIEPSRSLPIWDTMKENGISRACLNSNYPCEMSRIIVGQKSRGLGVAKLLAEAIVAQARLCGRDAVLLECLPTHIRLFQKLGYEKLFESLRYKHLSVPARVVAMRHQIDT